MGYFAAAAGLRRAALAHHLDLVGGFRPDMRELDDAGIDTLLTDDDTATRELLPYWTCDGVAPASGSRVFLALVSRSISMMAVLEAG